MKDSGIEWIEEIPKKWEIRRIKHIASLNGRIGWQGLTSAEYQDEGAYLITGINFKNGEIDWESCVHVPVERWEEAEQIQIKNNDLLITKDGTIGKVAIVRNMPGATSLNSGVLLIRTEENTNTRFLYWILQSAVFWRWFRIINSGNSTIIHLYQYDFCNFKFPYPSSKEQTAIADYLDKKCASIDSIIEKEQRVIEKFTEYKQSVITEAVTKGLNPDVPMKDSGIEWIGAIPEGWEIQPLKTLVDILPGYAFSSNDFKTEGIRLLRGINIGVEKTRWDEVVYFSDEIDESLKLFVLEPGDIVVGLDRPWINGGMRVAVISEEDLPSLLVQRVCRIRDGFQGKSSFIHYVLMTRSFQEALTVEMTGVSVPHISTGQIGNYRTAIPSLSEQQKIVGFLDKKCVAIDNVITQKQQLIDKLTEYKKSLIYEMVTGKKEVPLC